MTLLRRCFASLAAALACWAIATWATEGFALAMGPLRVSSRDPTRPLGLAVVFAALAVLLSTSADRRRLAGHARRALRPTVLAVALAVASTVVSFSGNSWTASGADAYAYVSQADLWLQGRQRVAIPIAGSAPWPNAIETFTPFGYRPVASGTSIVPVTPPGLSLAMAGLSAVFGHCAKFWLAPLCGGVLVWTAFLIGRRLSSEWVALGAAWLMATSPVVVAMAKSTMSDVPTAAGWAMALLWLIDSSQQPRRPALRAAVAGACAAAAIVVRPNLAPLAAACAVWTIWQPAPTLRARAGRVASFCAAVAPGAVAIAVFNRALYGSPFSSGYGDLSTLFSWSHVPVNLVRYATWLAQTQTPLALVGLAALAVPYRSPRGRWADYQPALLLTLSWLTVWLLYLPYTPFDTWWFLRFLLPGWAAVSFGVATGIARVFAPKSPTAGSTAPVALWRSVAAALLVLFLGGYQARTAVSLGVFPAGEGERRYATIAGLVSDIVEPSAVILTGMHVGSLRYYSGRLTLRYDLLDDAWLDRAVEWLRSQGHPPYLLLEDWELADFSRRFAARNTLGALALVPVLAYKADQIAGTVYLYDPGRPGGPTTSPLPIRNPRPRCVEPAQQQDWSARPHP